MVIGKAAIKVITGTIIFTAKTITIQANIAQTTTIDIIIVVTRSINKSHGNSFIRQQEGR
jgi:hypothetical protein